jgi:hypothetical protein
MEIVYPEVSAHFVGFEIIHDNLRLPIIAVEDYNMYMEENWSAYW